MIHDRQPGTDCPYCSARITSWPEKMPVHGCERCLRPLYIRPARISRPRIYRILPLFSLAKQATAIAALAILVAMALNMVSIRAIYAAVIITFFVHGSMDLADGFLARKSGIDRSWNKLTQPGKVPLQAAIKMLAGALLIAASLFGVATILFR
ncbi:MAG: hypothetical protein IPG54_15035 [Sphingomonadales bacterium]|nr:hypothetical protein [Sphingomonadales bacterium]